MHIGINVTVHI